MNEPAACPRCEFQPAGPNDIRQILDACPFCAENWRRVGGRKPLLPAPTDRYPTATGKGAAPT